jgi:8-oxo-dGTP pyrophosphatase MutT (NUDIX family)
VLNCQCASVIKLRKDGSGIKMEMNQFFIEIKKSLDRSLPGRPAQYRMAPEIRSIPEENGQEKHAAVLILLFPENKTISLALIKRTHYDGPHSGQISFPGGMIEKSDNDLQHTALRETEEELGISNHGIKVLGKLSKLKIPVSNIIVQPFVACLDYFPDFKPDPFEVDHVIIIPLSHLMHKDNIRQEMRRFRDESFSVPYYDFNGYKIWGATAMMMSEFLSIIEELGPTLYLPHD